MQIFVRPGDSITTYSELFQIPHSLIIDSNPFVIPNMLKVGETIQIPGYLCVYQTIQSKTSLAQIAAQHNLHLNALLITNPQLHSTQLQIGQVITVPIRITERIVNGNQHYDYETMLKDLRLLQHIYPFLKYNSIGCSVLNREIPELIIGTGQNNIHFNASFHANEWITTPIVMTFLNDYLLALTNNYPIRDVPMLQQYLHTTLSIVPMVNPDGVNLVLNGLPLDKNIRAKLLAWNKGSTDFSGWKANCNGVDLNDQFPADWEDERANHPKSPGPRDYGGEHPLTEPEAISIAKLTERVDFSRIIALHTQGEVIYWGYKGLEPPQAEQIVNEMARVSGYEPVQNVESYAGYRDWFIQQWRRPGFTVELGLGKNPLPISQFGEIYERSLGIFLAALYCE